MNPFQKLGTTIDTVWKEKGYDPIALPEIAVRELRASQLLTTLELRDIAEWLVRTDEPVKQNLRDFGQPPINLYVGEHFYIEALVWLDSSTAIHQHSFSGAFGVLAGGSVQAEYEFRTQQVISREVMLGELQLVNAELLQRGDIREITPGDRLIHSLFHLEHPSVSIVVRTKSITEYEPQLEYIKPFLAVDSFCKSEPFVTQLHLLAALREDKDTSLFGQIARDMIEQGSPWMIYTILQYVHSRQAGTTQWLDLVAFAAAKHGKWVEQIPICLAEQDRTNRLIARRKKIHDPVHRFFLALLLNIPDRQEIYRLIAQHFSGSDPESLVLGWLKELGEKKLIGLNLNRVSLRMLEHALHELSFQQTRTALEQEFHFDASNEPETRLLSLWNEIHAAPVLRPLLFSPGSQEKPLRVAIEEGTFIQQDGSSIAVAEFTA